MRNSRLPSCFVVPNFTLIGVAVVWTIVNCEFVEIGEIHLPNRGMSLGVLLAIFFSGRGESYELFHAVFSRVI